MKARTGTKENLFYIDDPKDLVAEADRLSTILDAKYKRADLYEVAQNTPHLSATQKKKLKELLQKYEPLFDGTIGTWKMSKYSIKLKEGATPYHGRPYQIPKAYKRQVRLEVDQLVKIGVLKKINHSPWAAPCFVIL